MGSVFFSTMPSSSILDWPAPALRGDPYQPANNLKRLARVSSTTPPERRCDRHISSSTLSNTSTCSAHTSTLALLPLGLPPSCALHKNSRLLIYHAGPRSSQPFRFLGPVSEVQVRFSACRQPLDLTTRQSTMGSVQRYPQRPAEAETLPQPPQPPHEGG